MFTFDDRGLKQFTAELDKLPLLYKKAMAATLNDEAFKFKDEAAGAIIGEFTSRRPDFVKRQMRVSKAAPDSMEATAGSVGVGNNPAFTGFAEPLGQPSKKVRAPTLAGRGGQAANILPQRNRMMPGANFPDTQKMDGSLPIGAKLDILHRQGTRRFLMGGPEFPAGLYEFTGEETNKGRPKVRMVQSFKKPKQQRRFDWVAKALAAITPEWIAGRMRKNMDFEVKKRLKTEFK